MSTEPQPVRCRNRDRRSNRPRRENNSVIGRLDRTVRVGRDLALSVSHGHAYHPGVSRGILAQRLVLMSETIRRFTGFPIASISQFAVTMNGVVAASLQFIADRSFAGAGKAFDQIIPDAHRDRF